MKRTLLKKIAVLFLYLIPASSFSQVLFSENFSTNALPVGWTNDSLGLPAIHLWVFNNPFSRNITGVGFDTHFAIFDSDEGSVNDNIDEIASLTTPDIDITAASGTLYLELDQQYRGVTGTTGGTRICEVSTNSGSTWTIVDSSQADLGYPNPAVHSSYDISFALPSATLMVRFHYVGSWDWWWAIDNFQVVSLQTCSGQPAAGTAQSNLSSVCASDTIYLSLNGADVSIGLHYQWQSSPDNVNWNDMTGDTLAAAYHSQSSDSYYRCAVTCSGLTSFSASVQVLMNTPTSCYCIPPFTTGCDELDKVTFNTISNIGSGCNGLTNNYIIYGDTGIATTTVIADSIYTLTIASGNGSGNHGAGVWFDFDHNGDFQGAGEFFHISDSIPELSGDFTTSIIIPNTAIGITRMRVRYIYDNPVDQASDCASFGYGETEDYTIHITNNPLSVNDVVANNITISPSPASDHLRISTGSIKGEIKYNLFDCTGRLCLSLQKNNGTTELNVSKFNRGIYFLRIETNYGSITKKIVLD